MSSLKKFEIYLMPTTADYEYGGVDETIDFDGGFNWASLSAGETPTEAFEKALKHLCECWPDKVDPKDVVNIRAEFEGGSLPRKSLLSVLQGWEDVAEDIQKAGKKPLYGIVIQVLLED